MFNNSGKMLLAAASVAVLAGCASPVKLDKPVEVEKKDVQTTTSTTTPDTGKSTVATTDESSKMVAPITLDRVIYFDFDSYAVKSDYQSVLEAHAGYLKSHPDRHVLLQGNTDERGTTEYNLALGQKRAEAVRRALSLLGVPDSQMEAVSLGKEKPAADGHDDAAYAQNRRTDLVYQ